MGTDIAAGSLTMHICIFVLQQSICYVIVYNSYCSDLPPAAIFVSFTFVSIFVFCRPLEEHCNCEEVY